MRREPFSIRAARPQDAEALAAMHVAAWRETYTGLLPARMLSNLSVESRAEAWRRIMARGKTETTVRLVECDDRVVAFGSCGPQRDEALAKRGFDGEISAIYVLRACQRLGLGRWITQDLSSRLMAGGCRAVSLWVLRENTGARAFYERLGGVVVGERVDERPDGILVELAYGWKDLPALL
ncbi:N-acetyltransferase [Methylobacterium sp. AMS5]|uniref:GNAT family N-acetyltransferase n=1 Tax=Methylobacterium sp. AMS5 TaxID=925818 RepID=UPI00074F8AF8|nr:N-acetyltransferase [Methylobacterium sp. AMS5]AMB47483.1 GNAT family acetyltransferase [Methylobacterium sp. AMS5]